MCSTYLAGVRTQLEYTAAEDTGMTTESDTSLLKQVNQKIAEIETEERKKIKMLKLNEKLMVEIIQRTEDK